MSLLVVNYHASRIVILQLICSKPISSSILIFRKEMQITVRTLGFTSRVTVGDVEFCLEIIYGDEMLFYVF
jgi:hypothetical protein